MAHLLAHGRSLTHSPTRSVVTTTTTTTTTTTVIDDDDATV
jgi:hypothetical protein